MSTHEQTKRLWTGEPDSNPLHKTVYAYLTKEGKYGCLEAADYKDARQHLGPKTKIRRRDIDLGFFLDVRFNDQLKKLVFYGATNREKALELEKDKL